MGVNTTVFKENKYAPIHCFTSLLPAKIPSFVIEPLYFRGISQSQCEKDRREVNGCEI